MTTLPNIGIELPDVGLDIDTWGAILNADLSLVDAHDHTSGKGVPIRAAALSIDGDVAFGGNGLTTVGRVDFSEVAALAAGAGVLFMNSSDHELYWRTSGGTNVKLTSGTSINTTLVGGILGDYTSVGAVVAYDDSGDRYTFKQQSGTWARLASGDVRLFEFNTTDAVFVGLAAPAALAGSYTITMPLAVPGSKSLVHMDTSGVLTATNTLDSNLSITLQGTGAVKHGDYIKTFHAYDIHSTGTITKTSGVTSLGSAGTNYYLPLPGFDVGQRIKSIVVDVFGNGADDLTMAFRKTNTGVETAVSTTTHLNQAASWSRVTFDVTDTTVADGDSFEIEFSSNGTAQRVGSVCVTYDRP